MADLVLLPGVIASDPEPVPEVVAMLERLLAEAKRGEIVAFAASMATQKGEALYEWNYAEGHGGDLFLAICDLQHAFAQRRHETSVVVSS